MTTTLASHRPLRPAPPRDINLPPIIAPRLTCFYDLPAELRIEIYKLALEKITVYILPHPRPAHHPHSLLRTSRQVRNEVLPIIHAHCKIRAKVIDFDFTGMLDWMRRIPPEQEAVLCKNDRLHIELATTPSESKSRSSNSIRNSATLRKWLHLRADCCRPQPRWVYGGPRPDIRTAFDMKRRAQRTAKAAEAEELIIMLESIGIHVYEALPASRRPYG